MAEKTITPEQVRKISALCNLNLTEGEVAVFSKLLTDTLDYINVLGELDTSKTPATYQVTGLKNIFLQDGQAARRTTLSLTDSLQNASEVIDNLFATKAVKD